MKALAADLPKVTRMAIGRRGFADGSLIQDWPKIVGPDLARASEPFRLSFPNRRERRNGTLTLRTEAAFALALQHLEPQLLERINGYFGYRAVERLKIYQGPLRSRRDISPGPAREADEDLNKRVEKRVKTIPDPDLRSALSKLAESFERREKARRQKRKA